MNDVNLNSPALKLVSASEQSPARAMPSSQAAGSNAFDLAPASPSQAAESVPISEEVSNRSGAEEFKRRDEGRAEELSEAVSQLNDYVQNVQRDLQFEVNNELGQTVVRVIDQQTQEVIRQIPDEVALRLAEKLQQDEPLTLFNIKI